MAGPKLFDHQTKGVEFGESRDSVAFLCDRGTGKTAIALTSISKKVAAEIVNRILYLAPLSTLVNVMREARRFTDNLKPQIVHGPRATRIRMLTKPGRCNMDIINYDGVRLVFKELVAANYDAIIFDESTRVKSRNTRVTQLCRLLAMKAKVKYLLTGMPFTEGVEDAWSQFDILDEKIFGHSFYAFRNRYCVLRQEIIELWDKKLGKKIKRKIYKITGYKKLDDLELKMRPYVYRAAKEDCLDLPDKTYQALEVPMLEAQRKQYKRVEAEAASQIADHSITHAVALSKIQKLRQVAAGFLYDNEHQAVYVPTGKYEALKDVLGDLYGHQKVVIFTSFRAEPLMVGEAVEDMKKGIKVFLLPVEPSMRQAEIDEWTKHEGKAALVANARSGGTGLNLTAAHMAIFMSNDWRMEDRAQAEDRIHRIGSEIHQKIVIVDIVAIDSVEEDILSALKSKKDLVEVFLDRMRRKK